MAAHHGAEDPELHPPDIEFAVHRVFGRAVGPLRIVRAGKEPAQIGVPVRHAREREVQSRRHLTPQHVP